MSENVQDVDNARVLGDLSLPSLGDVQLGRLRTARGNRRVSEYIASRDRQSLHRKALAKGRLVFVPWCAKSLRRVKSSIRSWAASDVQACSKKGQGQNAVNH